MLLQFQVSGPPPLIPAGDHSLTLRNILLKHVNDKYNNGKTEMYLWQLASDQLDQYGKPYMFELWTGMVYGNEKAKLTILLDQLVPGVTSEDVKQMDPMSLIGKRFKAKVRHTKTNEGKVYPDLIYIEPLESAGGEESVIDPFAK